MFRRIPTISMTFASLVAMCVVAAICVARFVIMPGMVAHAQAPIRVSVNEVIVPVTVTDEKGRLFRIWREATSGSSMKAKSRRSISSAMSNRSPS
jgi:hypothetical protein